jgi:hypothetical protein
MRRWSLVFDVMARAAADAVYGALKKFADC